MLRADGVVVIERLVPAETMDRVAAALTAAGGFLRLSHAVYNTDEDFERLRDAVSELARRGTG